MRISQKARIFAEAVKQITDDVAELPQAFLKNDPAARSRAEVLLFYPGVRAILGHRISNALWRAEHHFAARGFSEFMRTLSGVEIHPGATLGKRVVIDHGMGVVIGETATVADDVLIYQSVTLGGTSHAKQKRHPTILNGSVIGVGAAVLGNITVGPNAKVGANAVVLKDVAENTSVGGIPAVPLSPRHLRSV